MSTGPIAYLVNQYPKVSHSFIRREIHALERAGRRVLRYAVRGWDAPVADPNDLRERSRTRYLLREGLGGLAAPLWRAAVRGPVAFGRALRLAVQAGLHGDRGVPHHLVYLAQACRLLEWLRHDGATHLHAHFGTNGAAVAMLTRALGGPPYSFTIHGPEEFDRPEALGLREKVSRASFVVAVSSFGRSQIYRWVASADWIKVEVVHCGLEADFHAALTPLHADAPRRLVCVGRLCEQKGQLLLLDAVRVLADRGVVFELVLAGDGEMRSAVEARIAAIGLADRVRITGWVSAAEVRRELLASRALVLPSFAEGLPVVIMEAMSLGRPVLSTFIAGVPELVVDGDCGWLVPAGDVEALADAMQACLDADPAHLAGMGERARARVLARHDIERSAARLGALFDAASRAPIATA